MPGQRFSRAEAYAVLGLEKEASLAEIKKAYRRLAQNYHPDRYVSVEAEAREAAEHNFLRVQQAYEVLSE
ncbi:MAG: J domain-containing protein [Cellvibrionaceae bacterium]